MQFLWNGKVYPQAASLSTLPKSENGLGLAGRREGEFQALRTPAGHTLFPVLCAP